MGSEQHYSLRWNDYTVKIVTAFQSLRDEEDFVDVTVACDGHSYSAHKMVLSACSPYFRALLRANPCQHPIVILKDVGHVELERLLEFMYNGEVSIAQDQLAAFLRTAENLKIRGLAGSSDDMDQLGLQRPDVSYSYSSCSVGGGGGGGGAGGTSGRSSPSAGYAPSQGSKDEDVGGDGTGGYHARAESPPSKRRKRPSAPAAGHADSNTATHTSEGVVGEASVEVETGGSVSGAMGGEDDVRLDRRELKSEPGDVMADVYSETSELTDPASHEALDPRQPVLYPLGLPGPSGAAGNQDTIGPHEPGDVTNADYKAATRGELDIQLICSSHVKTELAEEWPQQAETLDVALMSLEEQEDLEDDPLDVSVDIVHHPTTHHPPSQQTADTSLNAEPVAYKILEKGSNRGGRLLIATNGYSYGVKKTNKDSTLWTCSKRSRELRCRATITQKNKDFRAGRKPHTHPPDPKLPLRAEITAKIKEKIREQPHKRATEIVTKVISSEISV